MKGPEIRQSFFDFFRQKQHQIVPSAPVVPADDPTLLFTNAGMNQFKPYFLGQATPQSRRIADTQKCIRVSGKHNDLEETGHDTYHHTFFEMLGNWSFGDYYKKEAIEWAWELLTEVWGLPKDRLYATVFGGDEKGEADLEAEQLWNEVTDIEPSHVLRFGSEDNFWMMGETGPCGPCSEIHIDLTPDKSGGHLVNQGSPLVIELWNLVFIQFNAEPDGSYRELPAKHVDTGMGFERACSVLECTRGCTDFTAPVSNYDTEVFRPLLEALQRMSGESYTPGQSSDEASIAMRVCADHIRMVSFAIADGALPSNEGRGYVVRRLLRRAARYGRKLGLKDPFQHQLVAVLAEHMGEAFPEILRELAKVEKIIKSEEESFNQTIDRGLALFEDELTQLQEGAVFSGEAAFKLYDTYGFPVDLTEAMAREKGHLVDLETFHRCLDEQRERARAAQTKVVVSAATEELDLPPTQFEGFVEMERAGQVLAVLGEPSHPEVVLDRTPFYAEMGGQLGDQGRLVKNGTQWRVTDTQKREGVIVHRCDSATELPQVGEALQAVVDRERRLALQRNHTATHLLHWALREVLGADVRQQGSLVAPERLRFDFTHFEAVKPSELTAIENLINQRILENEGISWFEIPYSQKPDFILSFFGDKYGDTVRVVKIGGQGWGPLEDPVFDGYSMELCGGTHSLRTGEIGPFRFTSEGAIAAGIRRVEAICGYSALEAIHQDRQSLDGLAQELGVPVKDLPKKLEAMLEHQRKLEKKLEKARQSSAGQRVQELLEGQSQVGDVAVVACDLGPHGADYLRLVADALRPSFKGIAVLAGTGEGKVSLLALVDKGLVKQGYHAGNLIREIAKKVGGGGGGRPDLAQAGGKDPAKLPQALAQVKELVKAQSR